MIRLDIFLNNSSNKLLVGDRILAKGKEFIVDECSAAILNYYHNEIDSSKFTDVMLVSMATRGETV
jgi:hypothetical protein